MSSSIIKAKLPCPFEGCNSSDGYYIYDDGHGHCYSCDTTGSASTEGRMSMEKRTSPTVQPLTNNRGTYTEIKDRQEREGRLHFSDRTSSKEEVSTLPLQRGRWMLSLHTKCLGVNGLCYP